MSANGETTAPAGPQGTERPRYATVDYIYDQATEGNVAANDTIKGSDFTTREGEQETASDEIAEVFKIEYIPARNGDGRLHTWNTIRLDYDGNLYEHLRYREFMLGWQGPDYHIATPILGVPVLSGVLNPEQDKLNTATPKFGPSTEISPALENDGTAIDDSFTVRLHTFRWQGTDQELQDYFQQTFGRTRFPQNITMSNPFTGSRRTYNRASPVRIERGADGGALGQFTQLTGGVDQALPKVWPWVTWATNNNATTPNNFYKFQTTNDEVDETWKRLEFDFTDQKKAVMFNWVQVNQPPTLKDGKMVIDSRAEEQDPIVKLPPTSRHQLPILRPLDGQERVGFGTDDLPIAWGVSPDVAGRHVGVDLLGGKQVIWDDGGGFRIRDNGTAIAADNCLIGVQGTRLELTS